MKKHYLALADGAVFYGQSCGAAVDTLGEAVFNTGMTGYQEIVSDPSYAGQFVVLSTSEVGNYGCNPDDMESRSLFLSGLIVREMNEPSNFRAVESLPAMLTRFGRPALSGIDTRSLVLHLRERGTQKAYLHASDEPLAVDEAVARADAWPGLDGVDSAQAVSNPEPNVWNADGDKKIVALDFGVKYNILRSLAAERLSIEVVPAWTGAEEILAKNPDGVFFSNGPGDPSAVVGAVETARALIGKLPIMGICLGHQILALACGAKCGRLKFGHHGCNHPVKNLLDESVAMTSQNHNFAVLPESLPDELILTHLNLNDETVEGLRHRSEPVFSVQFHPEAAPGPNDSKRLFRQFRKMIDKG